MPSNQLGFCLAVLLLWTSSAFAGAPTLKESCQDQSRQRVVTVYDQTRPYFAQARLAPRSERSTAAARGLSKYVIYVNPRLYFLGRQTQQWLYLRQCAHIREGHAIVERGLRALNVRDEEQADCWAARSLRVTSRTLSSIERDMERVLRDGRWSRVLPGPQRRIRLSSCR